MSIVLERINQEVSIVTKLYRESERDEFYTRTPIPVIILLVFYYLFVRKLGPQYMKSRESYKIDGLIKVYNLLQVTYIIGILIPGIPIIYNKEKWTCMHVENEMEIRCVYHYFYLKVFDLLETVFFVLRKKNRQISFLHVYHHIAMVLMVWLGLKVAPGGHFFLLGVLNCIVHVFMYIYYYMSAGGKKNIWWKKYITILQLTQFFILLVHFTIPVFTDCTVPTLLLLLGTFQSLYMTYLFGMFYYKTYILKSSKKNV